MKRLTAMGLVTLLLFAGRASAWGWLGAWLHPIHEPAALVPEPCPEAFGPPSAVWYGWGAPVPGATMVPLGDPYHSGWVPTVVPPETLVPPLPKEPAKKE